MYSSFSHNYSEIVAVLPEITANDFIKLCVECLLVDKRQGPRMNGNDYVCADLREAISRLQISDIAKKGLNASKSLLNILDVLCFGV